MITGKPKFNHLVENIFSGIERARVVLGLLDWEEMLEELDIDGVLFEKDEKLRLKAAQRVRVAIAKMFKDFGLKVHFKDLEKFLVDDDSFEQPGDEYFEPTGKRY